MIRSFFLIIYTKEKEWKYFCIPFQLFFFLDFALDIRLYTEIVNKR